MALASNPSKLPKVAVITKNWEFGGGDWSTITEQAFVLRHMAGAISLFADVEVIYTGGNETKTVGDGVFDVHMLAAQPTDWDKVRLDVASNLLARACSDNCEVDGIFEPAAAAWFEELEGSQWERVAEVLGTWDEISLIIVAGSCHTGISAVINKLGVPIAYIPTSTDLNALTLSVFDQFAPGTRSILTSSSEESTDIVIAFPEFAGVISNVGLSVPVNPSVNREPSTELADQRYVLVLCKGSVHDGGRELELMKALAMRFPKNPIVVVNSDQLSIWRQNCRRYYPPIDRQMDLWRLMAWAQCTVDLTPGELVGVRALESMRLGTPVVAPEGTRTSRHLLDANGGIWFDGPAELCGAVEVMLDSDISERLGKQARQYADAYYGSTARFVQSVAKALRLDEL